MKPPLDREYKIRDRVLSPSADSGFASSRISQFQTVGGSIEDFMNSAYRNGYLKSEHWTNLRLSRIAQQKGKCAICRRRLGLRLDVHHVRYKNLYDVSLFDLKALCRGCHDATHLVLELTLKLRDQPRTKWDHLIPRVKRWLRYSERAGEKWANMAFYCNHERDELEAQWSKDPTRKRARHAKWILNRFGVGRLQVDNLFMTELMARFNHD